MRLEWNCYGKENQRFVMISGISYPVVDMFEAIDKVNDVKPEYMSCLPKLSN